jgi:hypothetical protein
MLATIALATDLPMLRGVEFRQDEPSGRFLLYLTCTSIDDGVRWAEHLDIKVAPYLNADGNRYLGANTGSWCGWDVVLWASEKPGETDHLDEDTTAALAALANEGADQGVSGTKK